MARTEAFDANRERYEEWFQRNPMIFESELAAIRELCPGGRGLEVGVGTGLFARGLGIKEGVEPSSEMAELAVKRGIHVARASAENLPFPDDAFDYSLMVTTLCFVDNPTIALSEMKRVTRPGGIVIQAFIDKASPLGKRYGAEKENNPFYRNAVFHDAREIIGLMESQGLVVSGVRQSVIGDPKAILSVQAPQNGQGMGGFVVIAGRKP